MAIRDLLTDTSSAGERAAVCVVGAGIAGLLLAVRLARKNIKVIVLESGGRQFDPAIHALNEIDDPGQLYTRSLNGRYRGLGGTSSRWGGRMIPLSPAEFGHRAHIEQDAWPIEPADLDRYGEELETLFTVGHDPFEDLEAVAPGMSGILPAVDEDFRVRWAKCPTFKRSNIVTMLGEELRSSRDVTVWLHATVGDFGLDREGGRLQSLTARSLAGTEVKISAEQFVIAAGTIESTRLLLLLDEASDRRAFSGTDALGRYFQDHLKAEIAVVDRQRSELTNHLFSYRFINGTRRDLHLELTPEAQIKDAVASGFIYVAMDLEKSGLAAVKSMTQSLQQRRFEPQHVINVAKDVRLLASGAYWRVRHKQLYVPPKVDFRLMASIEQLPDAKNKIVLSSRRDQMGIPMARFDWSPQPVEGRTFRSIAERLRGYWKRAGFDTLCPLIWSPSVKNQDRLITEAAEACAHPSGSARMGINPATSVVRPDLRCHAVPNLAVVSAAVFPCAGSANPTFTLMKLALWLADSYSVVGGLLRGI